jgi:hypothetical protein
MPKSARTHETSPELQKIICDNASAGTPLREIAHFTNLPLPSKLDERALHHAKIVIHQD